MVAGAHGSRLAQARLNDMQQLRVISLFFPDTQAQAPPSDAIFAALPPSITELSICCGDWDAAKSPLFPMWRVEEHQLAVLVRSLPQLRILNVGKVHININAFAALSSVAQLNELTLKYCAATQTDALALRRALSPLPHLTTLTLLDEKDARLMAAEAEPLTVALLARCPKLTRANFKQNLKD